MATVADSHALDCCTMVGVHCVRHLFLVSLDTDLPKPTIQLESTRAGRQRVLVLRLCQHGREYLSKHQSETPKGTFFGRESLIPAEVVKNNDEMMVKFPLGA